MPISFPDNLPRTEPLAPTRIARPFDHPDWIFELKHDGFRAIAYVSNGPCTLVSRRKNVYKSFARLCAGIAENLRAQDAILDGEIVCLDPQGRSMFNELLYRRRDPVFYAFDLLWFNGTDRRCLPLVQRKARLRALLRRRNSAQPLYADHVEGGGTEFFRAVCDHDLEGIVAKHKREPYSPSAGGSRSRTRHTRRRQDCVYHRSPDSEAWCSHK